MKRLNWAEANSVLKSAMSHELTKQWQVSTMADDRFEFRERERKTQKCRQQRLCVCLYNKSAHVGKSHSTSLSYSSPTLRIKPCFRAWANAASQGFISRLSRKRISAWLKPTRSAKYFHSFPPHKWIVKFSLWRVGISKMSHVSGNKGPVVPEGAISRNLLTTSCLSTDWALEQRQRMRRFVSGSGCSVDDSSNDKLCCKRATTPSASHVRNWRAWSSSSERTMACSPFPKISMKTSFQIFLALFSSSCELSC